MKLDRSNANLITIYLFTGGQRYKGTFPLHECLEVSPKSRY